MAGNIGTHVLTATKEAYRSGDYSDLIITCGDSQYNVHRVLVCSSSEVLAAAVRFPGKEFEEGKINLPEEDPVILELMLQYMYEGDYAPKLSSQSKESILKIYITNTKAPCKLPHTCVPSISNKGYPKSPCDILSPCPHHICGTSCITCHNFVCARCLALAEAYEYSQSAAVTSNDLLVHASMYATGEKYCIIGLKDLAQEKFSMACSLFWDDDVFPQAATYVHKSTVETDQDLRSIVHRTICEHIELIKKGAVKAVMDEFDLTMAVLVDLAEEYQWCSVSFK